MVFTNHITDYAGALFIGLVISVAELMHGPEHAPVDGLKSVANIRQRASDDYGHGIVEIRAPHLVFDVYMIPFRSCFHPVRLSSTIRPLWALPSNLPSQPDRVMSFGFARIILFLK